MTDERGIALLAALILLVAVSALVAGAWVPAFFGNRVSSNRASALRAALIAEGGCDHALAITTTQLADTSMTRLLRGPDDVAGSSDDGRLAGWDLPAGDEIPSSGRTLGGGRYYVKLVDDPADGDGDPIADSNGRLLAECRGEIAGAEAEIRAVLGKPYQPGLLSAGELRLSGDPIFSGGCGSVHSNRDLTVSGSVVVSGEATSSDSIHVSGSISDEQGNPAKTHSHQQPREVPHLDYGDYCPADADYVLQSDGRLLDTSDSTYYEGTEAESNFGWSFAEDETSDEWDLSENQVVEGTYCSETSVRISGEPGDDAPVSVSVFSAASVVVSGDPGLQAAHPEGHMFVAEGDLRISGDGATSYSGLMYAGSQCRVSGNPSVEGTLICADEPNPAGTRDYLTDNRVSGDPSWDHQCRADVGERQFLSWFREFGG